MAATPAHIVSGISRVRTDGTSYFVMDPIYSFPGTGNILRFELTGSSVPATGSATYKQLPNFSIYLFNDEQAMVSFVKGSSGLNSDPTTLSGKDKYECIYPTMENRGTENPAFYLIFTDTPATIPAYPANVSVAVSETPDMARAFNVYGRRRPHMASSTHYPLFLFIKFASGDPGITQVEYKVTLV